MERSVERRIPAVRLCDVIEKQENEYRNLILEYGRCNCDKFRIFTIRLSYFGVSKVQRHAIAHVIIKTMLPSLCEGRASSPETI